MNANSSWKPVMLVAATLTAVLHGVVPAWSNKPQAVQTGKPGTLVQAASSLGRCVIYVTDTAVRLKYEAGLNMVYSDSNHKMVWYNTPRKLIMTETIDEYRQRYGMSPTEIKLAGITSVETVYAGMPAKKFCFRGINEIERGPYLRNNKSRDADLTFVYETDRVKLSPDCRRFFNSICGIPDLGGVPLGFVQICHDGSTLTRFQSFKTEKANIKDDVFKIPTDYKVVHKQSDVAAAAAFQSQLEDLAKDMGLGDVPGDTHKP